MNHNLRLKFILRQPQLIPVDNDIGLVRIDPERALLGAATTIAYCGAREWWARYVELEGPAVAVPTIGFELGICR